jgi:hypothetical protein
MPGYQDTPAESVLLKILECFGNLLFKLAEYQATHTYAVVSCFCQLENIEYLVLRYLKTSMVPFEEFSEEWLFDDEISIFFISETGSHTVSIWKLLWRQHRQEVES